MVVSPDAMRALVEPPLASAGLELWDVEISGDTVRVLVDRPGGIDLDALADLAGRVVSPLLDEHPELTPVGQYSLEVSSPGVERILRRPDHFERYIGTEVSVKTKVVVDGARRHQGRLVSAGPDGIVVARADGSESAPVRIGHEQIDRARIVLVWSPTEKPGGKKPKGGKSGAGKSKEEKALGGNSGAEKVRTGDPDPGDAGHTEATRHTEAVKRPAASGLPTAAVPVASREKESE